MKLTDKDSTATKASVPPNFRDRVSVRINKAKFAPSGKGDPMLTLECEIVHPNEITVDGQKYVLDSQGFTLYPILKDERKGKMPQSFLATALDFNERLGLPREFDTDTLAEKASSIYEGIVFEILLSSQEDVRQRKNPDTGEYEAIKDDNGKPMTRGFKWNAQLGEVLGLTTNPEVLAAAKSVPQ